MGPPISGSYSKRKQSVKPYLPAISSLVSIFQARFYCYKGLMTDIDITIIGAGVIGLAIADALCPEAGTVLVLEKEARPGMGISSRNSEVIHAGMYYPPNSLKARLCVEGSRMLMDFCESRNVPYKKIGKVIVAACPEEEPAIEELYHKGLKNAVSGLKILDRKELFSLEPNVHGTSALHSPNTGIIDSHRLVRTLEASVLEKGGTILCRNELTTIEKTPNNFLCRTSDPSREAHLFSSRVVINAGGLTSDVIASLAGIDVDRAGYRIFPMKGEYFRVKSSKQSLVNGLVYPVPEKHLTGLGIHATKDLSGSLRLGPNAFSVDTLSYDVDPLHGRLFFESTRRLLPFLEEDDLFPDMAGIRPKIQRPGEPVKDFIIQHEDKRGLSGMINLIGIESPGLTSCLALAGYVKALLKETGLLS